MLLALGRDNTSTTRGGETQIVFDKVDNQDFGIKNTSSKYMYAPYRSEKGQYWHQARIISSGEEAVLSIAVIGTFGTKKLADILSVWFGGFKTAIGVSLGLESTNWENADGFQRSLAVRFVGASQLMYPLDISDLEPGLYTGRITLTLNSKFGDGSAAQSSKSEVSVSCHLTQAR